MQTVRRLYVYLLSGITLGFLVFGLITLVEAALGALGVDGDGMGGRREQLSLAAALIERRSPGMGHPLVVCRAEPRAQPAERRGRTALHRASAVSDPCHDRPARLRSICRARPHPRIRAGLPAAAAGRLLRLLRRDAFAGHAPGHRGGMGLPRHHPSSRPGAWPPGRCGRLAAAAVLLRRHAHRVDDHAAGLRRPGGLCGRDALGAVWHQPDNYRQYPFADALSLLAVWAIVWIGHWWYAGRLLVSSGWRASSERASRLRIAFFVSVILAGASRRSCLTRRTVRAVLIPVLGATDVIGGNLGTTDLVRAVAVALASAVPWAVAWWLTSVGCTGGP